MDDHTVHDTESLSEAPQSFEAPTDSERWAEISFSADGVGVTVYEPGEPEPRIVDETWLTIDEVMEQTTDDNDNITLK